MASVENEAVVRNQNLKTREKLVAIGSAMAIALGAFASVGMAGCAKNEAAPASIEAPAQIEMPADAGSETEAETPREEQAEQAVDAQEERETEETSGGKTIPAEAEDLKAALGDGNSVLADSDEKLSEDETNQRREQLNTYLQSAFDELKALEPPRDDNESYRAAIGKWFPDVTPASRIFQQLICNGAPVTIDVSSVQILKNASLDDGVYKLGFTMSRDGNVVAWFDGYWVDDANYIKLSDFKLADGYVFDNINRDN